MPKKKRSRYKTLDEGEYYRTGIGRGVIKVTEDNETKEKLVSFSKEIRTKTGDWIPRKGKFFAIPFRFISKLVDILVSFARRFGWKVRSIEKPEEEIKELKKQLDDIIKQKSDLEEARKNLEFQIESYETQLENSRQLIIKTNIDIFKKDLEEFEKLLKKSESQQINEEEIQKFLTAKRWIFSPEYYKVEPKKPAGSKSQFDYYLEDYKGKGTIVELEKPSDPIFSKNEKYGLSSKCAESLGQLIRYIETTIAIGHSREVSRIEKISEVKPLGFLIIGRTKTDDEVRRLETINFYFARSIEILSYDMLLKRTEALLSPFIGEKK